MLTYTRSSNASAQKPYRSNAKTAWFAMLLGGLFCCNMGSVNLMAESDSDGKGFGLLAHWPFDVDYSSTVNNGLYQGKPFGGDYIQITKDPSSIKAGQGALRLDSGDRSGNKTYVSIRNPLFGYKNADVFTVVAWYRYDDLSSDGSDSRNFVWETTPGYSLAFGLGLDQEQRDAEWWFQTASHSSISDTTGPQIKSGEWNHTAMIWNQEQGHAKFFHNGLLRDHITLAEGEALEEMSGFHIGNHRGGDGARDWDGMIDDVAVYDLELTPRQIKALAEGTFRGTSVHPGNVLQTVQEPKFQSVIQRPEDFKAPLPLWNGQQSQGPFIGHVSDDSAIIWARSPIAGSYSLDVYLPGDEESVRRVLARATEEEDYCLRWEVEGLAANTKYRYRIRRNTETLWQGDSYYFHTAPSANLPADVTLVFGSCASSEPSSIWHQIREQNADGVVLLGDTPYIDVTDLDRVRDAYRRFSSVAPLAETFRSIPFWGTWDDHDFGRNDSDGTLPGKEHSRRGFVNYRANPTFGQDNQGIYTKFRYGPVEVFLLDTRWFARTEPSWADPDKPTLLGRRQWEWLQAGLLASDASFKLLACGMIWDDKKNSESDDWGTYMHERQAIQSWLGENQIEGVVLIGGDIHVSRLLKYDTVEQVGYPLYQFISSPMHGSVIPSLNVPHPALVQSAEEPFVFLKLSIDSTVTPATLRGAWMNRDGETIFTVDTNRHELSRQKHPIQTKD